MCELMGMSANVPTDVCFSFSGLMQRGGATGPHKDGWGIAFYEGKAVQEFRDPQPSFDSPIAKLIRSFPIKSCTVISHIRQANVGEVSLENTHPFVRELWGRKWTFAHNGQLPGVKELPLKYYKPVGATDSEHAFCWMLGVVRDAFPDMPAEPEELWRLLKSCADQLLKLGVCNLLICDAEYLYAYCSTKLHVITRRAPFGRAKLNDTELSVDFGTETTPNDIVTVVATQPLTNNESWRALAEGEFLVLKEGLELTFNE